MGIKFSLSDLRKGADIPGLFWGGGGVWGFEQSYIHSRRVVRANFFSCRGEWAARPSGGKRCGGLFVQVCPKYMYVLLPYMTPPKKSFLKF